MPSSLFLTCFHACKTERGRRASERHWHTRAPGGLASDSKDDDSTSLAKVEKGKKQEKVGGESKTDGRITFPFICKVRQFRWIDESEFDG